jgi:hypothetical protein
LTFDRNINDDITTFSTTADESATVVVELAEDEKFLVYP